MSARLSILISALFWGLLVIPAPAFAASLYTGEALLDVGETATGPSLRALDEVLVRLTGITDRSLIEELGLGSGDLRLLVSSEQRIRRQRPDRETGGMVDELRLKVDFDAQAVDRLLARHDLPRLGRERPAILLWLAVEGGNWDGDGHDLSLSADAAFEHAVVEHGRRLGLDVIRPLGDLMDLSELEPFDIRGGFLDSAVPSARRYGAGMIAMLDLRRSDEGWLGRWFWRLEDRDDGRQLQAETAEEILAAGLEYILSALAERFAVTAGVTESGQRRVRITGVADEVQYVEILRYLEGLGAVADVRVTGARGREVELELNLSSPGFEDALAIGGVLAVEQRLADGGLVLRLLR